MDSPCIKQTVCKVLKIFQYGKYLVAYVFSDEIQALDVMREDDARTVRLCKETLCNNDGS